MPTTYNPTDSPRTTVGKLEPEIVYDPLPGPIRQADDEVEVKWMSRCQDEMSSAECSTLLVAGTDGRKEELKVGVVQIELEDICVVWEEHVIMA